ncbi:hypothetical protein TI04_08905, partial [Achromatium sp. WMS2]
EKGVPADMPIQPAKHGIAEAWSRVYLADGLELHIGPERIGLNSSQIEQLITHINQAYKSISAVSSIPTDDNEDENL